MFFHPVLGFWCLCQLTVTYDKPMTKLPYILEHSKVADSVLKHWTVTSSQWLLRIQVNLF